MKSLKIAVLSVLSVFILSSTVLGQISLPTPEQRAKKEESKKVLKELQSLIEEAKKKNIDTLRFEAIAMVGELGLDYRWLMLYQEDNRFAYCEWVNKNCKEASNKLKDIIAGKEKSKKAEDWPDYKKAVVKDGFFTVNNEPVIYYGMNGGSGKVEKYFFQKPIAAGCSAVGGSRYNYQDQPIGEAYKKYPDTHRVWGGGWCGHIIKDAASIGGTGQCVICLESPNTRNAVSEYIRKEMPKLAKDPGVKIVNLGFEYYYICFCDYTKSMFQDWLKAKYSKIEALNSIWKTDFKDFSDVTLPDKNHLNNPEPNDAKWYDFGTFNLYRFTEYLKWAKSEMKKIAPDKMYCAGAPFYYFSGMLGSSGIDTDALNEEVNDAILNESHASTVVIDLLWSLGDGKKIVIDPEYHGDIAHIYSQFLHGEGYMSMWWWPNSPSMDPPSFYASAIPWSNEIPLDDVMLSVNVGIDVRTLGKYITPFSKISITSFCDSILPPR